MALIFLLLFAVGALVASIGVFGLLGRLPPNSWAGIRIPYAKASVDRWYDVHRGAAPIFIFGGVGIAAVNLAFLPFAVAGRIDGDVALVIALISVGGLILTVLQAAYFGVRYSQSREL